MVAPTSLCRGGQIHTCHILSASGPDCPLGEKIHRTKQLIALAKTYVLTCSRKCRGSFSIRRRNRATSLSCSPLNLAAFALVPITSNIRFLYSRSWVVWPDKECSHPHLQCSQIFELNARIHHGWLALVPVHCMPNLHFHGEDRTRPSRVNGRPLLQKLKGQLGGVNDDEGVSENRDRTDGAWARRFSHGSSCVVGRV